MVSVSNQFCNSQQVSSLAAGAGSAEETVIVCVVVVFIVFIVIVVVVVSSIGTGGSAEETVPAEDCSAEHCERGGAKSHFCPS